MAGSSIQGSVGKQRGVFIQGAGTQIMHSNTADVSGMAMLTDRAKKLLNDDEVKAIIRHVNRVRIVNQLLVIRCEKSGKECIN